VHYKKNGTANATSTISDLHSVKSKFQSFAQTQTKGGDIIKLPPAGAAAPTDVKVDFTLAGEGGKTGPGMPKLSGDVQGEKEWQQWAGEHVEWLDNQTSKANARPPYNSTFLMFDVANGVAGGPGMPTLSGNVHGEKEWQGWAQDHVDW
jgi:hypothetical protein